MSETKLVKTNENIQMVERRPLKRPNLWLTIFLMVTFCMENFLTTLFIVNESGGIYGTLGFTSSLADKIFYLILSGLASYVLYVFLVRIYMMILSFNLYSVFLPQRGFLDCLAFAIIIRNICVFAISIVILNVLELYNFFKVFVMLFNILAFVIFVTRFCKKYIDTIALPFIFQLLFRPYYVYLIIEFCIIISGVYL